jgi:hypothetical protein
MSRALQPPANQATVPINTGSESEHIAARAAVTDFPAVRAGARWGVMGSLE